MTKTVFSQHNGELSPRITSYKNIKLIAINVNSLVTNVRRHNLQKVLEKINPDIALISETKLSDRHKISFEKYKIHRDDRAANKGGGGTAVLIKNHVKHHLINIKSDKALKIIETTIIKIPLPNEQNLFTISTYAVGHNKSNFARDLNIIFNDLKLYDSNNWHLLAGDLNVRYLRWQDSCQNPRGLYLNNWLNFNDIKFRAKLAGQRNTNELYLTRHRRSHTGNCPTSL